jgi:hypothetical protein
MSAPSGEILFLRVPPRGLVRPAGGNSARPLRAVLAPDGFCGRVGERAITCFWIGLGRRVRTPGRILCEKLRGGTISEIVDIGCVGALDPSLRRGDLVLSSSDVAFDGGVPPAVIRRPELRSLFRGLAASRGTDFRRAPILTHERMINSREERIELFKRTGCIAVQMEHVWFLVLLQSILSDCSFDRIRVTHLGMITDAVPRTGRRTAASRSAWDALTGFALPGVAGGIASLRRESLSRWPAF